MATTKKDKKEVTTTKGSSHAKKRTRSKRVRPKPEEEEDTTPHYFHCNYCKRDLTEALRARCAQCKDYDTCLDCLSVGAALHPHKHDHDYRILFVMQDEVYQKGWTVTDEIKMLEGLEEFGVGNWEQVSETIMTKTAEETEQHFLDVYLGSQDAPLPDTTVVLPAAAVDPPKKGAVVPDNRKYQDVDSAGWMSKREDFVYDWDNEQEEMMAELELSIDDSKQEHELVTQILEIYNEKLLERHRRKEFATKHGLVSFKKYVETVEKLPEEEKEVREKLKPFMRLLTKVELDKCVAGILEERELRDVLAKYRRGRELGAKSVKECSQLVKAGDLPRKRDHAEMRREPGIGASDAELRMAFTGRDIDLPFQAGAELLTRRELKLCSALKITVHQYVIVKEVLVRESARTGHLRKKDAKGMVRLDSMKVYRIYDYLLSCGWIRSEAAA